MKDAKIDLSVIIPAYNEAQRLGPTLQSLTAWVEAQPFSVEILVVDDGSTDDTCGLVQQEETKGHVRCLSYGENRGKGYAVGWGVAKAQGGEILFTDADLSTPIEEYFKLKEALETKDIAIGSRALPDSDLVRRQPIYREIMGRTFNVMVQTMAIRGIRDTQCGFKLFRAEAAKACFRRRRLDGFAFDVEILFLAQRLGYSIAEVPVKWQHFEASRVDPLRDSLKMFADLAKVRLLHFRGKQGK